MNTQDLLVQANLIIGALLPLVASIVIQSRWRSGSKSSLVALLCLVAAVVSSAANGRFDAANVGGSFFEIMVTAKVSYDAFWKPVGLAPALEKATNLPDAVFDFPEHEARKD